MSEDITPFAALLQDYMWSQRPPLSASKLADRLGVAKGTVWNWLHARRIPPPDALAMIHDTTGISLLDLLTATNTAPPASVPFIMELAARLSTADIEVLLGDLVTLHARRITQEDTR